MNQNESFRSMGRAWSSPCRVVHGTPAWLVTAVVALCCWTGCLAGRRHGPAAPSRPEAGTFCPDSKPTLNYSRGADAGRQRKHAVCISGSRLEHLWHEKVKGPMMDVVFMKNDVDVFVFGHISPLTPNFQMVHEGAVRELQSLFGDRLAEARVEDPGRGNCEGQGLKDLLASRASKDSAQGLALNKLQPHVLSMFRSIAECDRLVAAQEDTSGRPYRLVVRLRADLFWETHRPLLLDAIARKQSGNDFFVFPPHCFWGPNRPDGGGRCVNMNEQDPEDGRIYFTLADFDKSWFPAVSGAVVDQVFIGRSGDMHKVAAIYDQLREGAINFETRHSYKPEVLLHEQLRRSQLNPRRIGGAQFDLHRAPWHQTHQ